MSTAAVTAIAKNARMSPQKARLVADQIRGLPVGQAVNILRHSLKSASDVLLKVVLSAVANAEHNEGADIDELKVVYVAVDQAPVFKRFRARAKGRSNHILKRNCHITVAVGS